MKYIIIVLIAYAACATHAWRNARSQSIRATAAAQAAAQSNLEMLESAEDAWRIVHELRATLAAEGRFEP